jgi:acyl-lipid omega-6 desaturase (Delta-12 desaturase)
MDTDPDSWKKTIARYQTPDALRSWWQVMNSLVPYFLLWYLMVRSLEISYWLTLLLAIPAAGFMMRTFIIFHDCGHGSFFKSKRANDTLGIITGILTFTPYYRWRRDHAVHHATAGDLDRRGVGDIWTLTVKEYRELPAWKKLVYRVVRSPLLMFTIGAPMVFLVNHRLTTKSAGKRERYSVYWTNLALAGIILLLSAVIGFKSVLLVQLPIVVLGTSVGVWLFYVQHQFEGVYWERHERWDYLSAALQGASYYKLPKVLQWFTGNIGFHHVHHLSPRIPNYYLERCHKAHALFQQIKPLTLWGSMRSLSLRLWDEDRHQLVGFGALKQA